MKVSKTREELVKMYIDSLKEGDIPWRQRWTTSLNVNGISNIEYKGINQLLLSLVTYNKKYDDNRWLTFKQIKDKGYKIKDGKGKGVPIEFWSVYDIENKRRLNLNDYEKIMDKYMSNLPSTKETMPYLPDATKFEKVSGTDLTSGLVIREKATGNQ